MITGKLVIVLFGSLAVALAAPQTVLLNSDPNQTGQYVPDNSGQYVPDNSGQYVGDQTARLAPLIQTAPAANLALFNPNIAQAYQFAPAAYRLAPQAPAYYQFPIASTPQPFLIRASPTAPVTTPTPITVSSTPAPITASTIRPIITAPLRTVSPQPILAAAPQPQLFRQQAIIPAPAPGFLPATPYAVNPNNYLRILRYENDQNEVAYRYAYETENGIAAGEEGHLDQNPIDPVNPILRATGSYSYPGPDGKIYTVTYTADERGFIAQGDHLPTPPPPQPYPAHVVRQLELLAARGLLKK